MNHRPIILSIILSFILSEMTGHGSDLDMKYAALRAALKADEKAQAGNNPATSFNRGPDANLEIQLSNISGDGQNAESQVRQIMAQSPSDTVSMAAQNLIDAMKASRQTSRDANDAAVNAVIAKIPHTLETATKPSDLDELAGELQRSSVGNITYQFNGDNDDAQRTLQRLNSAIQFVTDWQNYLSHLSTGNSSAAQADLQALLNNSASAAFFPRSEVLARVTQGAHPAAFDEGALIDGIKTPDDIAPVIAKIKQATPGERGGSDLTILSQDEEVYENARQGLPQSYILNSILQENPFETPSLTRIKAMVLLYVIPRYIGATGDEMPQPGETLVDYLHRVTTLGETKGNIDLLQRITSLDSSFLHEADAARIQSIQLYTVGLAQESAGQYSLAVASYEESLRNADSGLVGLIGDKLAGLKKNHPADFKAGYERMARPSSYPYSPVPYPAPVQVFETERGQVGQSSRSTKSPGQMVRSNGIATKSSPPLTAAAEHSEPSSTTVP